MQFLIAIKQKPHLLLPALSADLSFLQTTRCGFCLDGKKSDTPAMRKDKKNSKTLVSWMVWTGLKAEFIWFNLATLLVYFTLCVGSLDQSIIHLTQHSCKSTLTKEEIAVLGAHFCCAVFSRTDGYHLYHARTHGVCSFSCEYQTMFTFLFLIFCCKFKPLGNSKYQKTVYIFLYW